jgi:hypothetical protein
VRQPPYLPDMISFIYFPIPKLKQNLKWQGTWWGQNWTQHSRLMVNKKSKKCLQPMFPPPTVKSGMNTCVLKLLTLKPSITLPTP